MTIEAQATTPNSAPKTFVRDLQDKQTFNACFLAKDKTMLTGKNGKQYISVYLADSSGQVDARIWDNVDIIAEAFQSGDVVRVKGQVQIFQSRKQVVVHKLERALPEEYQMKDLVSAARRSADEMMAELLLLVQDFEDPSIRQLVSDCLNDSEIRPKLLRAPAAKSIHHAYSGGLLEHVLSICGLMKSLHAHYRLQDVNMKLDYLLFGAIFHDIGKIWELDPEGGITYTDKGKLLGHMIMAVELVEKKASRIFGFPEETKDHLKHIILSHHGRLDYGSPKVPQFLEAFLVAAIDDLDSKINTISMFIKSEREAGGDKWSRFNQLFERYFLLQV
ncbi:MAG: HD domain-containing protein [Proteobacteria bacterium]|nr:MAG: HD domain-containing protein [Pseudomonadota bacterium]